MSSNFRIEELLNHFHHLKLKNELIDENDLIFLAEYLKKFQNLIKAKELFEKSKNFDIFNVNDEVLKDVSKSTRKIAKKNREAAKLSHVIKKDHFKSLIECMKEISNGEHISIPYDGEMYELEIDPVHQEQDYYSDESDDDSIEESVTETTESPRHVEGKENINASFQHIGLHRDPKQPLGITVVKQVFPFNGVDVSRCCVERILVNSLIDKQDLLQVGDIIFEINNQVVENPEALRRIVTKSSGTITFKVLKTYSRPKSHSSEKSYVRALFDYDPNQDQFLPAKSIGLPFNTGDVFEIINRDDVNYWQALPLNSTNCQAYLVPSQELQEKILSLKILDSNPVANGNGTVNRKKTKKNDLFSAKNANDISSAADLCTYEEVVKFEPTRSPCLVLVGPSGIGKKALKHIIVSKEPNRFAFPIKDTSEPKKSRGQPLFNHISRSAMINDINSGNYVCVEEIQNEIYGIKSSSIKEIINQGKTAVIDCKPSDIYNLKKPFFNPYIVMVAAPSFNILEGMQKEGLQRNWTTIKRNEADLKSIINESIQYEKDFKHLFNSVIYNKGVNETSIEIINQLNDFESRDSWIPASWEYNISVLPQIKRSISREPNLKLSISNSNPRKYEKKADRPSVTDSKKMIVPGNVNKKSKPQEDNYASESTDSSESEIPTKVVAKSVKYEDQKPQIITGKNNVHPKRSNVEKPAEICVTLEKPKINQSETVQKPIPPEKPRKPKLEVKPNIAVSVPLNKPIISNAARQSGKMVIKTKNSDSSGISETSSDD